MIRNISDTIGQYDFDSVGHEVMPGVIAVHSETVWGHRIEYRLAATNEPLLAVYGETVMRTVRPAGEGAARPGRPRQPLAAWRKPPLSPAW